MKSALLFAWVALAFGALACEGVLLTPTPAPQTTPEDAESIFGAADENLRAAASFRVAITAEGSGAGTRAETDIFPLEGGRFAVQILLDSVNNVEIEVIQIGESQYALYPGFQAWFDFGGETLDRNSNFQDFPYDLGGIRETAESFELLGEGIIDGENAYRLIAKGTGELRQVVGFALGVGEAELEMWISKPDLFPLRIEARVEDPETMFTSVYSDFGADVDVSVPENVIHVGLMDGLMEGALSPEQLGEVVRALPVLGQQCIEAEIGVEVYREVIGGDSEEDFLVLTAFSSCESEIFPLTGNP